MDLVGAAIGFTKLMEPEQHPQLVKLLNAVKPVAVFGVYLNYLLIIGRIAPDNADRFYSYFTHNRFPIERPG